VRNCTGIDNRTDIDRVAEAINRIAPDVVALQELDSMTLRHNKYMAGELAHRTLMHATYAPAIKLGSGGYGVAILSKERPIGVKRIPLPGSEERRMLLVAEFEKYVVLCTHFSLTESDRLTSARIVLDAVAGVDKPVFLAGDMNDENDSEMQKTITERFTVLNDPRQPTIGSDDRAKCIDFIYALDNGVPYSVPERRVLSDEIGSDHKPLWVDVRIAAAEEDIVRTKPWLQNPTNGGVTVTWLTNVPTHSVVEYSTDRQNWRRAQTILDGQIVAGNKIHKVRLAGLDPGTRYYYRTLSREITLYEGYRKEFGRTAISEVYSFRLPTAGQDDFSALVLNDLHKGKPLTDTLMMAARGMEYDFVLLNGDIVDDPKDEAAAVDFLSYLTEKVDAANHPIILLRGNHEIRNAYSLDMRDLLDYPGGKTYGAFNWGDTRFVMLDCGEDKPDSNVEYSGLNDFTQLRLDQVDFLREELASEAFLEAGKRVLIHHIPVYGQGDRFNPGLELWGSQLATAPFDVAIHGHTHRRMYHPRGTVGNNFPLVIGGSNSPRGATVMLLSRQGDELRLKMLSAYGETLHDLVW
jgi:endonuclease/exonuclease/phosphatase family metal-dependent hydrolase/predicted phosphodiesterase